MPSQCLDAAIQYLNAGLAPVVLTSPVDQTELDAKKRGKVPLDAIGWTQKPIPTEAELRSDFTKSPLSNIGLRTGIIAGARVPIIGFDIDGSFVNVWDSAISEASAEIKKLIDSTWIIKTGAGKRPIFAINRLEYPEGSVPSPRIVWSDGGHDEIALLGNGRHSVAPPSIHSERRTEYSSNDKPIQTITRAQVDEIIRLLEKHNPVKDEETDSNRDTTPIEDLFKPGIKYHDGEARHIKLRRVIIQLVRKNAGILTLDKIKELASDWNNEHTNLPATNFNKRWSDAIKWLRSNSELIEKDSDEPEIPSKYKALADKYGLAEDMLKHVGAVIQDSPPELVIANTDDKRVKIGYIKKAEKTDPESGKVLETWHYLLYTDTILDAIPERITIIKDPLEDMTKYEVELVSANGDVNTFGPLTFTEVIKKIEDTPLCFKPRSLQSYLAPLLRAYIESGRVEHKTEIDREGFFYVDGKLQGSKIEIMPVSSAQAKEAVRFIETLKTQFYSKQRDTSRLAHCLRLAVVAPFDFARRQMGVAGNNNFIPRLDQYGWANTGKTYGYPKIILRIWRREVEDYLKGNGSVDTAARFIKQTSYSTMPLVLDEVDFTSSWEKDGRVQNYIAILKNQCSMTHPRDTLTKESEIVSRPSLSFPILTHNSDRITEDGFVKRYVGFGYTPDDEISKDREANFTKFLEDNKEAHGAIGDFVAGYIVANQDVLKDSWEVMAEKALRALYDLAAEPAPAWLWSKVEHSSLNDTKESREGQIKAATLDMINAAWAQNRHELTDKSENRILSLSEKIERLVRNNMLPHIRLHKTEGICLLSSYVEHLKEKYKITRISMAQLSSICQWRQPHNVRLGELNNPKVVSVPLERFVAFLTDSETATQTSFL